jgi:glycine/D-amino acid oxidase-like deaminating enzyme
MPSKSLWLEEDIPKFETFDGSCDTDVAVIGGGITGLTCAYLLKKSGLRVILLEANRICRETSGHTTAKITSQQRLIYTDLSERWGREIAHKYATASQNAIEQIKNVIDELAIECDFVPQRAYIFTADTKNISALEEEAALAKSFGIDAGISTEGELPIPMISTMYFENQAAFHPVKYMRALAAAIEGEGSRIYENSRVLDVEDGAVKTDKGTVNASHIIVATHYPFINFPGLYWLKMYQHRSFLLAVKGVSFDNMHLSLDSGGHTFRMSGEYAIIGGADHKTGKEGEIDHYKILAGYIAENFPGAQITHQWSAQDCMSPDGLTYIGQYGKSTPNMYVASGFSKWGMTNSMISARILHDKITGKENEFSDIFSPERSVSKSVKGIGENVLEATAGYARKITKPQVPTCTHLGCKLEWNDDEKSWDCPCHGSRFDENGKVLQGPAVRDLDLTDSN